MRLLRHTLHICIVLGFAHSGRSQEVVATSGNYAASAQGSLSWTLGEPVTETFSQATGALTQGFQQNYEDLLSLTGPDNYPHITIFPNPFASEVHITHYMTGNELSLDIVDIKGSIVLQKKLFAESGISEFSLDLSGLAPGAYQLRITTDHRRTITEPIIKIY